MNPLDLVPAPWRLAVLCGVAAALLAVGGGLGWMVNGWRLEGDLADAKASFAQANAKALRDAVQARDAAIHDRDALGVKLAAVDATASANLRKLTDENDTLRARVRDGSLRVRVNGAVCPGPRDDVPQAPAGSGVDSGAGVELAPEVGRDVLDFRAGIIRLESKLAACQGSLRELTGQ